MNTVVAIEWLIHQVMKMTKIIPLQVELEPGTTMRFWVPSVTIKKPRKHEHTEPKPKSKPAVVLIHGFSVEGIFNWQFQVLALTKKYSVYIPDLLFFGKSTTDKPDRTPTFQAQCTAMALQKLGVKSYTLVGLSYGGFVSFKMAELYPDRVEAVVVSGSTVVMTEALKKVILGRVGYRSFSALLQPESVEGVKALWKTVSHNRPSFPTRLNQDYLKMMFSNRKEREELLEALVIKDADYAPISFPHISSKRIHLIWGEHDKIFSREWAQSLKEQLGDNATYQEIKRAGHVVNFERPCVYNRCLMQFLDSLHYENSMNNEKNVHL